MRVALCNPPKGESDRLGDSILTLEIRNVKRGDPPYAPILWTQSDSDCGMCCLGKITELSVR